jgi:hypothetical protein
MVLQVVAVLALLVVTERLTQAVVLAVQSVVQRLVEQVARALLF